AVPAKSGQNLEFPEGSRVPEEDRDACLTAARLFGLGYSRRQVAKAIQGMLFRDVPMAPEHKYQRVRARIRKWERAVWFRDLMWVSAVVELDMAGPAILKGVTQKAKRGRVDAAKLALAITGRHNERASDIPAQVTINLGGVPRPAAIEQAVTAEDDAAE